MGEGRQVKRGKDLIVERKTKGALLREMIVTAHDQPNGGNACGLLHGPVNSKGVGLYVYILASLYHHDILTDTQSHYAIFFHSMFLKSMP